MSKSEINFSDRAAKRVDPHAWEEVETEIRVRYAGGSRLVALARSYECKNCGLWSPLPPKMTHSSIKGDDCEASPSSVVLQPGAKPD